MILKYLIQFTHFTRSISHECIQYWYYYVHTRQRLKYTAGELYGSFGDCPKNQNCEGNFNWARTANTI